jgi:CheY-like chemotaxis protein
MIAPVSAVVPLHDALPDMTGEQATRSLRVLVVDNDPLIIEASEALLASLGHEMLAAREIAEALPLARQADVALIDYDLDHGENGLDLIDNLRAELPNLPLAVISATQNTTLRAQLRQRGVPFYAKPVEPADLAAFLARASHREVEAQ